MNRILKWKVEFLIQENFFFSFLRTDIHGEPKMKEFIFKKQISRDDGWSPEVDIDNQKREKKTTAY